MRRPDRWLSIRRSLPGAAALALALELLSGAALAQVSGRVEILDKGDAKRKLVREVLVYIDGPSAPVPPPLLEGPYRIESRDKSFVPHVAAVPRGAEISFPNSDDIMHNVFSLSRGNSFDLGLYKSGASKTQRFDTPGLVRVYCNIHPQMSAFVLVMDHAYYAWAEPDGRFRIEGVPPGRYRVKAWHEQAEAEVEVTVGEQGARAVDLLLDARRFKPVPHLNKFGKPYKRKRGKY